MFYDKSIKPNYKLSWVAHLSQKIKKKSTSQQNVKKEIARYVTLNVLRHLFGW